MKKITNEEAITILLSTEKKQKEEFEKKVDFIFDLIQERLVNTLHLNKDVFKISFSSQEDRDLFIIQNKDYDKSEGTTFTNILNAVQKQFIEQGFEAKSGHSIKHNNYSGNITITVKK